MTDQRTATEDRWVLPREGDAEAWQYRRPGDRSKEPPREPVQDVGDQGSLDLPNDGDLDVGDSPGEIVGAASMAPDAGH